MTADSYSRFILTVIAVCLIYLCVRERAAGIRAANAGTGGDYGYRA